MTKHLTNHQIDVGSQIDELYGIERTKEEIALQIIRKTLALGVNLGIARQDLLAAVFSASRNTVNDEHLDLLIPTEAEILLQDYCHVAGFDLYTQKESIVKHHMPDFVQENYVKHHAIAA
ncbi:MAG TPA: hypothetical protein VIE91_00830 [Methylophilaceae bacterium]|jgi:hypothetical protein